MADYKLIIPLIKKWEGGLSDDPNDTWPAKYPAPCTYTDPKSGRTSSSWHTNKGIIWATYTKWKQRKGEIPDCAEWFEMSDKTWNAIFKSTFWDLYGLDDFPSTPIANILVKSTWGSGTGAGPQMWRSYFGLSSSTSPVQIAAHIKQEISAKGEKQVFDDMWLERERYFKSLGNARYIQGWLNAWNDFYKYNLPLLGGDNRKTTNLILFALGILAMLYTYRAVKGTFQSKIGLAVTIVLLAVILFYNRTRILSLF